MDNSCNRFRTDQNVTHPLLRQCCIFSTMAI